MTEGPVVVRVLYVDEQGKVHRARTVERPKYRGGTTQILVKLGPRITVLEARYSKAREPGTWSRLVEPA